MPIGKDKVTFFDRDLKPESLQDVLRQYDQSWIEKLRTSLEEVDRVATGSLQQSMEAKHEVSPNFVSFRIVGNSYWKTVNYGRRAGKKAPPVLAMMEHIRNRNDRLKSLVDKLQYFQGLKSDVRRHTPLTREKATKQLAFILGQGISKRGFPATNFVTKAIGKEEVADLRKGVAAAIKKGLLGK